MADKKPKFDVEPSEDGKYWATQDGKRIKSFDRLTDAEKHIKGLQDPATTPKQPNLSGQEQLDQLEKQLKDKTF